PFRRWSLRITARAKPSAKVSSTEPAANTRVHTKAEKNCPATVEFVNSRSELDRPTLCSQPWENARSPEESTKYWESPTSPTVYCSTVEVSVMVSVASSYCRTMVPTKAWFTLRGRTAEDSSTGTASSISSL